jgi:hypothetical protein
MLFGETNNFVKTLSNFHSPVILRGGMKRKRRDPQTKRRERDFSEVDCPTQQKTYCTTYHKIDKGNGAEAKYDISTESHLHGWPPKLAARYFNMNSNNTNKVYVCLHKKHHPDRKPMSLRECINNLTRSLLQQGLDMRQRGYGAPPSATKDISTSSSGEGRSIRSDSNRPPFETPPGPHGTGALHTGSTRTPVSSVTPRALYYQQAAFNSSPAIMPLAALYFGVYFFGGHISLKNGTICPLIRHDTSSFKDTCLIIKLKVLPDGLYGAHLHCKLGQ